MPRKPIYTNAQIADYLVAGNWRDTVLNGYPEFADKPLDWFRMEWPATMSPGDTITYNMTGLTSKGQYFARNAFEAWAAVSGLNFRAVSSGGNIVLDDERDGARAWSARDRLSASINVSKEWIAKDGYDLDTYSFQTFIHEIGHTLGLGHAGFYKKSTKYSQEVGVGGNLYLNDSWQVSVMSYFDQNENTYINASHAYVVTPMVADILAIQDLFGVAGNLRAGNTVYGNESNAGGYYNSVIKPGSKVAFTILDDGGTDTLNFTSADNQRINLNPGQVSDVFGLKGNMVIAEGTVIENANTGSGNDIIFGNSANNVIKSRGGSDVLFGGAGDDRLYGGGGNDKLYGSSGDDYLRDDGGYDYFNGGSGSDTVSYFGHRGGMTANLLTGKNSGGDTYSSIENLMGSNLKADNLTGNNGANKLWGQGGSDQLYGLNGNDGLYGGSGNDRLYGQNGNDRLYGGTGNDKLYGGSGNDYLRDDSGGDLFYGGSGYDTASYYGHKGGMTANLLTGKNSGGDTYVSIENLMGSNLKADSLTGNHGANKLWGQGGNDKLYGLNGNDYLYGGAGNDSLYSGKGNDSLYGGSGSDSLFGRTGNDRLYGGVGNDRLYGESGNDRLYGGSGYDRLWGGSGADVFVFQNGLDQNIIYDFNPSQSGEQIDLRGVSNITSYSDLTTNHLSQYGSGSKITVDSTDYILLADVSLNSLSSNDFII